jgi:flagellar biosynthetic protein FliP
MRHRYGSLARVWLVLAVALLAAPSVLVCSGAGPGADEPESHGASTSKTASAKVGDGHPSPPPSSMSESIRVNRPADLEAASVVPAPLLNHADAVRTAQTVALFGLVSLAPIGLLMVTAFVRINIVLILLRQALGSPQVPGNQILTALALLLTALVMRPKAEEVYRNAIQPYAAGQLSASQAWDAGAQPIKAFMVDQIVRTKHQHYLEALNEYTVPASPGRIDSNPSRAEDYALRVVAPAYLLSELTAALLMGFYVYLPFLVIDLVVSSILAATGLFMLPPGLVATPVKLIVFVLADGWLLTAAMLLSSFAVSSAGP